MRRLVRMLVLAGVSLGVGLSVSCSECDTMPCMDQCDETYPNDDRARSDCYTDCQLAADECEAQPDAEPSD